MSLSDSLKELGNTTPSLSLIVSLITGASIIVTGIICKKHAKSTGSSDEECKHVPYVGAAVITVGVVLFYFAQETNLAMYEGLWIILATIVSTLVMYKANQ